MTGPSARARTIDPSRELGERFAELLKEPHAHQIGVCARLGIPWGTHKRWMAAEDPKDDVAAYQAAVLLGLDRARINDLKDAYEKVNDAPGTHASTVWNMRKHAHESRFRRFYDEPTRHELTGKDGGPIQHQDVKQMTTDELAEIVRQAEADE